MPSKRQECCAYMEDLMNIIQLEERIYLSEEMMSAGEILARTNFSSPHDVSLETTSDDLHRGYKIV